ncbi:MAG: hypothetical protein K9L98_01275 [Candidatus Pacebacteria bacterium]|nr:hypothetical protein [Candidatus Paceibacterota bacterium]MCF7862623.1 hypothetical protein [Candidatus Paceibacterota bacterium]
MFGEEKNLKDNSTETLKDTDSMPVSYQSLDLSSDVKIGSYTKSDKLITALYLVTDILDRDEPIRTKLRLLGAELLSDIYSASSFYRTGTISKASLFASIETKVSEVVSFLEIAFSINIISEMNLNILKKEFAELKKAVQEFNQINTDWMDEFMQKKNANTSLNEPKNAPDLSTHFLNNKQAQIGGYKGQDKGQGFYKGNIKANQTGGNSMSETSQRSKESFDVLKKGRRENIINILKSTQNTDGMTITEIKEKGVGVLANYSEKTLQRELVSMVKDGVLKKEGDKRWSRYFVLNK